MSHKPIAYHCPACAEARFGRDKDGFIPEDAVDDEGNQIGAVAPWDEYELPLVCGTCGGIIEGEAVNLETAHHLTSSRTCWSVTAFRPRSSVAKRTN